MLLEDSPAVLSLGLLCGEIDSNDWKQGESPSLIKDGKVMRCKPENLVPLVVKNLVYTMTLRRRRATDCKFQVPDHQQIGWEKFLNLVSQARRTQVSMHRETGRTVFQSGFNFSKEASLAHNVVVEQLVIER